MNITALAADIAVRVPDMAKDSRLNNEALLARLIRSEYERTHTMPVVCAWCKKSMGSKPCLPDMAGKPSHGCCDDCVKQFFPDAV